MRPPVSHLDPSRDLLARPALDSALTPSPPPVVLDSYLGLAGPSLALPSSGGSVTGLDSLAASGLGLGLPMSDPTAGLLGASHPFPAAAALMHFAPGAAAATHFGLGPGGLGNPLVYPGGPDLSLTGLLPGSLGPHVQHQGVYGPW